MHTVQPADSRVRIDLGSSLMARGIVLGCLGGFAATLVMDLILMGILAALRQPVVTCFALVGDTLNRLFSGGGIQFAGIPFGVAAHYIIGPLMGAIFGAAAVKVHPSRVDSLKKTMILAVVYAEILSQPILALPPILLSMTAPVVLAWYGGSFVMHIIWGCILGVICYKGSKGLRLF